MKRQISSGYVFAPAASPPTLDLTAVPAASFGALLAVINVTRNALLYVAGQAGYGGSYANNVLSLQASTSGHAGTDVLQVILDDGASPALDSSLAAILAQLRATLAVSGSVGVAGVATDATLQSILAALKAQINVADLMVTDGVNFYVRRETANEGTGALSVAFENLDGTAAAPTVSNLKPITGSSRVVETAYFDAATAAAGYAAGDILARVVIFDTAAAAVIATAWQNVSQGTTLAAAPASATIVEQTKDITVAASALPSNAAQEAGGNLAALAAALGGRTDAVAAGPAATASLIALIRLMAGYESTLAGAVSSGRVQTSPGNNAPGASATGAVSAAGSNVTLAVDGYNAAVIQLTGTWSGLITWQGSVDGGATYFPINMIPYSGGANIGSAGGNGQWETAVGGLTHLQAVALAALGAGSANVLIRAATGLKSVRVGTAAGNPVATTGSAVTLADRSGTTSATPNTFTTPFPANPARQFARITNLASGTSTATVYVWDKAGNPTIGGSVPLAPGQSITWDAKVPGNAIQVAANGAAIAFEAAEG